MFCVKVMEQSQALLTRECRPGKRLKKLGTVAVDCCESTPVVWKDRLLRLDIVERQKGADSFAVFIDPMTGEEICPRFAKGAPFPSAYTEGDVMYVIAPERADTNVLMMYSSRDLIHWETEVIFTAPKGWTLFNTSLCASPDGYTIALEINGPRETVGIPFTIVFLRAPRGNIHAFELMDPKRYIYTPERYSACPVLRWADGFYYMIYLEALPLWRFAPYIVRTLDLETFEVGLRNPVLFPSDEDKQFPAPGRLSDAEKEYVLSTPDINNSDVDLCEYRGKTFIVYSWGIQLGKEFLAHAEYDGPMEEFLKSFF